MFKYFTIVIALFVLLEYPEQRLISALFCGVLFLGAIWIDAHIVFPIAQAITWACMAYCRKNREK